MSRIQQKVLQPQLAVIALAAAFATALSPFDLMVQGSGVASGAGFVDLHVRLPLRMLLALLLVVSCLGLLVPLPKDWLRRGILLPLASAAALLPISEWLVAPLIQRLVVQPRELQMEAPYIKRSIAATRRAFGLDSMQNKVL